MLKYINQKDQIIYIKSNVDFERERRSKKFNIFPIVLGITAIMLTVINLW